MKFQLIDAKKAVAPVSRLCQCLGVSVSGYYAWKARKPSLRQKTDMVLLAYIRSHFTASGETYGSPRMHAELKAHGVAAGRHRIARLMRDNDLKAHQKRRYKRTTDSQHGSPVAPNLLDQDFAAPAPNQKWGVDISYIWTAMLAVPGDRAGPVFPSHRRLGNGRSDRQGAGNHRAETSDCRPAARPRFDPPFRSWQSVLFR
jgi:putative transposase